MVQNNYVLFKSNVRKSEMNFCESSKNWSERKKFFQARKLNFLISIKESYERKLAAITASISKLEEQMNSTSPSVEG